MRPGYRARAHSSLPAVQNLCAPVSGRHKLPLLPASYSHASAMHTFEHAHNTRTHTRTCAATHQRLSLAAIPAPPIISRSGERPTWPRRAPQPSHPGRTVPSGRYQAEDGTYQAETVPTKRSALRRRTSAARARAACARARQQPRAWSGSRWDLNRRGPLQSWGRASPPTRATSTGSSGRGSNRDRAP